jgi:hypothetical protein
MSPTYRTAVGAEGCEGLEGSFCSTRQNQWTITIDGTHRNDLSRTLDPSHYSGREAPGATAPQAAVGRLQCPLHGEVDGAHLRACGAAIPYFARRAGNAQKKPENLDQSRRSASDTRARTSRSVKEREDVRYVETN